MNKYTTNSLNETLKLGKKLVKNFDTNIIGLIGELGSGSPKAQKFHTRDELNNLGKKLFSDCDTVEISSAVLLTASRPKKLPARMLREAIEFEFDLPYPDGKSLGMADYALEMFSKRLGVDL